MTKEKKGAMYMADKDNTRAVLVHGDDIEARTAEGYTVLSGPRGDNGEDWNRPKDQAGRDAAANAAKVTAELDAKESAEENKAREDAQKLADKAAADAEKGKAK